MKRILLLDSHSLSDYQKCPQLFQYTKILGIEPSIKYLPFEKGTVITEMLESYYKAKREESDMKLSILKILNQLLDDQHLQED